MIFIHCLSYTDGFVELDNEQAPTLLLHVCRFWRRLALSTQKLWSNIWITPCHIRDIHTMRGWLNLSGDHPLTIYLSIDCDKELARHALYLMLVTMDRWECAA